MPSTSDIGVFQEHWYKVLILGKPSGYIHSIVSRREDGTVITETYMKSTVKRREVPVEMKIEIELQEASDGAVKMARTVRHVSKQRTITEARVSGDKLEVAVETSGTRRNLTLPYDPKARGTYWIDRERVKLKKPGDAFQVVKFDPLQLKCTGMELRFEAREGSEAPGAPETLNRIGTTFDSRPALAMTSWVDAETGVLWKSLQEFPGLEFVQVRSSRGEAMRAGHLDSAPELLLATSVKPNRPLPRAGKLESAVFRVRLRKGDFKSLEIEKALRSAGQTLVREESPSSRVVRVSKVAAPRANLPLEPPPELSDSLAASSLIQSDDAAIRARARSVVADTSDAFEAAKKLERWVHDHIRKNDLNTGFASAKETLETGRGDCSEHGVLLAALARAAGMPARIVVGLVYNEGRFIGHLWTEVYIDGWVPLDATRPDSAVGPTHIALVSLNLSDASGPDAFGELAPFTGNLEVEILEP